MSSNGDSTTFKEKNTFGKGRHQGSRNKQQIAIQQAGLDRAMSILETQLKSAEEGNESAAQFLLSLFIPRPKPGRFVKFSYKEINTVDDILPAQREIMKEVASGHLTIDEGEKVFEFIEHHRKTIEVTELVFMIRCVDDRVTHLTQLQEGKKQI